MSFFNLQLKLILVMTFQHKCFLKIDKYVLYVDNFMSHHIHNSFYTFSYLGQWHHFINQKHKVIFSTHNHRVFFIQVQLRQGNSHVPESGSSESLSQLPPIFDSFVIYFPLMLLLAHSRIPEKNEIKKYQRFIYIRLNLIA